MAKRKIPKAVFEPLEKAVCAELVAMPSLVSMIEREAPIAIREAHKNRKTHATLFEINGLGLYVDIPKQDWVPALEQCIDLMSAKEMFEDCILVKELINEIKKPTKAPTKKSTKKKKDGTTPT